MTIESGQELLHYRLTEKLGEGGMGVVWKAVDTTLNREVAIKVLPPAFTDDPERLARFEREAKVLASLNHPNIAAIHSLHEANGVRFLALELVDGEDLAQRLMRGPLPVEEAVERTLQIAQALEVAHEQGVIHRDLKPANVKVASDGTVKVLDFGLAKAMEPGGGLGSSSTALPTVTSAGTVAGALLGTAAYMSPEQARGLALDRRGDVWSLGCLLYELLTGKPAFGGETITDVLAAIVHKEPDLSAIPPATPPGVRNVMERCLRKDARERLRDMGDIGLLLREAMIASPATDTRVASRRRSFLWPAVVGLLGLLLVVALVTRRGGDDAGVDDAARIIGMSQLTDLPGYQTEPSLSPDGKQLLYVTMDGGDLDIFLRRVGGEKPVNLTADHAGDDVQPAFSPDGERIAFRSDRQGGGIFVMGATGETPRRVSDEGYDPAWSPDGTKLVYAGEYNDDPYNRMRYLPLRIFDLDTEAHTKLHEMDGMRPTWSPNGKRVAFWTFFYRVQGQRDIMTIAAGGGEPVAVTDDVHTDWDPVWSPDGRWLYFVSDRGGSADLWRVAIDETTGVTRGDPLRVTTGTEKIMQLDIAADGRIAVVASRQPGEILRYDFDPVAERVTGNPKVLVASSNVFRWQTMGFDDRTMLYSTSAPLEQLYSVDIDSGNRRLLLSAEHRNLLPQLSPDGRWIAFYTNRSGSYDVWALRSDGTGLRQLTRSAVDMSVPVWLADGDLVVSAFDGAHSWLVRLTPGEAGLDGVDAPLIPEPVENGDGMWAWELSPNGRRLTVAINVENGVATPAVYDLASAKVQRLDEPDGRPFAIGWEAGAWLDDERYVFWDIERRQFLLADAGTGTTRVFEGVEGRANIRFAQQGRVMIANRYRTESDVWLLTLAE